MNNDYTITPIVSYIQVPKNAHMHQRLKSLQGILSPLSAAATETYSTSLCITIILKCDVEHRDAKISSICCTCMPTEVISAAAKILNRTASVCSMSYAYK